MNTPYRAVKRTFFLRTLFVRMVLMRMVLVRMICVSPAFRPPAPLPPVLLPLALLLLSGCTIDSIPKFQAPSNPFTKNTPKSPTRMVDVWNTYAQTDPNGGKPIRGIGGRIVFYQEGGQEPVKVDGRMIVYLFDGDEQDPQHAKPLKKYVVPAETLQTHYSKKEPLGHGYDFYLPLDAVGGPERTLCILARFEDAVKGQLVLSRPVVTVLQGTGRETAEREMIARGRAQDRGDGGMISANAPEIPPGSHAEALEKEVRRLRRALEESESRQSELTRRTVARFNVPENFSRRMIGGSSNPASPYRENGATESGAPRVFAVEEQQLARLSFGRDVPDPTTGSIAGPIAEPVPERRGTHVADGDPRLPIRLNDRFHDHLNDHVREDGAMIARREYPVPEYPEARFPSGTAQPSPFNASLFDASPFNAATTGAVSAISGTGSIPASNGPVSNEQAARLSTRFGGDSLPASFGQPSPSNGIGATNPRFPEGRSPYPPAPVRYAP